MQEHIIKFKDGTYYTGKAGSAYQGTKEEAFRDTSLWCQNKIKRMGWDALIIHSPVQGK